jgi:uridine kinase
MSPDRARVLRDLANAIAQLDLGRPVRVAIDGLTAAGKTTLADEIAALLREERPVTRLSIDDYHRPPEQRHRRGRYSPEGYYHDTFDYPRFLAALDALDVTPNAVILVDGVFLLRPELDEAWDYRIFVEVDPAIAYQRSLQRDATWMGGEAEARRRHEQRYIPGERLYLEECDPISHADAVIENTNPAAPQFRLRE